MRQALLFSLMLAWPALAQEAVHALPPEPASPQSPRGSALQREHERRNGTQTASQRDLAHASDPGRARTLAGTSSAARPERSANDQPHSTPGTDAAHSLVASRFGGASTSASNQNTGLGGTRHVARQTNIANIRPSPVTVRHRGANAAAVGGASNSTSKNAGALNGSLMARKP